MTNGRILFLRMFGESDPSNPLATSFYCIPSFAHSAARLPQDFRVSQDKTGQTKVGDLSAEDMKKVRRLVLIEMSALFDTCGIEVKAHKALRVKVRGQCLRNV